MSQNQLAKAMEISRQAVSKWENGQSTPDATKMIKLAEVLNTDVEYLTTGRVAGTSNTATPLPSPEIQEKILEKVVEKPVIQVVERVVEKAVPSPPVVQTIEKPVIQKVYRTRYVRNPLEMAAVAVVCFLLGFLIGHFL
jgi:transcriptional regulator with XRE-family HTH domain